MSKKKKGVLARLRFPEFRDAGEWVVEQLGEVYSFHPTNSFSRDKLSYESGTIKNIHYGDIHTKFAVLFDITKEQVPNLHPSLDIEKLTHEAYCKEGDIILADASEDIDDIGKSIEIVNLNGEKLVSGLHTIMARKKSPKLIVGFGGYLFRTAYIREQIKREAQGAKVFEISPKRLSKITVIYPSIKAEQQKIADCLSSRDEVIDLEAQKLEALRAHKKGLMQQLFPREGETTPRLRFPEFRNAAEWVVERLGDVVKVTGGGTPSTNIKEFWDGSIPWVSSSDIAEDSVHGINVRKFITEEAIKNSATRIVPANSILLVSRVGIGKLAVSRRPMCTSQDFTNLTPVKDDALFLAYYLKAIVHIFESFNQGMAIKGFTKEDVENLQIALPNFASGEQQKIAGCLSSLDEVIELEAQNLDALKAHKKGLMQQLFPQEVD